MLVSGSVRIWGHELTYSWGAGNANPKEDACVEGLVREQRLFSLGAFGADPSEWGLHGSEGLVFRI